MFAWQTRGIRVRELDRCVADSSPNFCASSVVQES